MTNIYQCRICGRYAMAEELSDHECRELLEYKFDGEITLVYDGEKWYPLKNAKPTDLLLKDPTDHVTE